MSSSRQALYSTNAYQPGANGGIKDEGVARLQGAETNKGYYDTLVDNKKYGGNHEPYFNYYNDMYEVFIEHIK